MRKIFQMRKNLSLKRKWAYTASLIIFISYAFVCIVIFMSLKTWLINNEELTVNRTMDDLMVLFESNSREWTIQQIQQNTGLINEIIEKDQTVRIYNRDGIEVLRINDSLSVAPIVIDGMDKRKVEKQNVEGKDILVESQPIQLGLFSGYLQVAHPLGKVNSMLHYILTAMLIAGIGTLLLSAFIGYGLANVLMRPIEQLRESMQRVKEEGFNVPVQLSYASNDEIGELLDIYNDMMRELQISFVQQQQFVSDASHELRTPIQALEGHLSMLKRWGKNDLAVLDESLDTSLEEIKRMKKLIEELLALAKREKGTASPSVADLTNIAEHVKSELLMIYPYAHIDVRIAQDFKKLAISESALGQILRNIFENAIRYCNDSPHIQLTASVQNQWAFIEIYDNGIGIADEHVPFIFDRFYRVDKVRNRKDGGTGLGLSITKLLVEKYGGLIEVKSILGQGSEFIVKLPLKK